MPFTMSYSATRPIPVKTVPVAPVPKQSTPRRARKVSSPRAEAEAVFGLGLASSAEGAASPGTIDLLAEDAATLSRVERSAESHLHTTSDSALALGDRWRSVYDDRNIELMTHNADGVLLIGYQGNCGTALTTEAEFLQWVEDQGATRERAATR